MSARTLRIVRISTVAGLVAGVAGVVGLVGIGLNQTAGEPWGIVADVALAVMVAAFAPLMLSFYELGGLTPLRLAQLAQTLGWISVVAVVGVQILLLTFGSGVTVTAANSSAFLVANLALGYIGLWIAGANLLAGPWLSAIRWLGVVAGMAAVAFAFGQLVGGADSGWTWIGGLGLMGVGAVWAFLMSRLLRLLPAG